MNQDAMQLRLFNSLSRQVEVFEPINDTKVLVYACGPTVYDYAHIGHMRKYVGDDVLVRTLESFGYEVRTAMNVTDVGHLVSDGDTGEDKMEKGARKHGMDVWQLSQKFTDQFFNSTDALNIRRPEIVCKATDYIAEQIQLVKRLEENGLTYRTADGIYFDVQEYVAQGNEYGQLSHLADKEAVARVKLVEGKKDPRDFALWKFSPKNQQRQMEWDSPWGKGFPGWHVECSAMSMAVLGSEQIDIHTGGKDHVEIHHPNEIAQSEGATGKKPFVKYWVHHNFLMVEGEKMSKSLGNLYTVADVIERGIEPLALRYLFLQTHYRKEMNFTWEALEAAETSLKKLWGKATVFGLYAQTHGEEGEPGGDVKEAERSFLEALADDLNTPKAVAALHEGLVKAEDEHDLIWLMNRVDAVLGLELVKRGKWLYGEGEEGKASLKNLLERREQLRDKGEFAAADKLRHEIEASGYEIRDRKGADPELVKKQ